MNRRGGSLPEPPRRTVRDVGQPAHGRGHRVHPRGLAEERRVSDAHESLQRSLLGGRPGTTTLATDRSETASDRMGVRDRISAIGNAVSSVPGLLAFGRRSRLDTVLDRAVEDARMTFPIATFTVQSPDGVDVVADEAYLEEVFEIVLERLVLYNDASDPHVEIRVGRADGGVEVRFGHNGSGLPESVGRVIESGDDVPDPEAAELVFVETFVTRWGGSTRVDEDSSITLRFVRPRLPRLFGYRSSRAKRRRNRRQYTDRRLGYRS